MLKKKMLYGIHRKVKTIVTFLLIITMHADNTTFFIPIEKQYVHHILFAKKLVYCLIKIAIIK